MELLKKFVMKQFTLFTGCLAAALFALSCQKSGSGGGSQQKTSAVVPAISINSVTQVRDTNTTSTYTFAVSLSQQTTDTVTIQYQTADSSAFAGKDYTASSGSLVFLPGSSVQAVRISVTPSDLRSANTIFLVKLSNPANGTLATTEGDGIIQNQGNNLGSDTTGYQTPTSYVGYKLSWNDEFTESAINTNYWQYDLGNGGWGNNELECYTDSNASIANGYLVIQAKQQTVIYDGVTSNYTSTRMNTGGGKFSFQYGRVDIRAKLPVEPGMWPALWFLGNNFGTVGWPACGETDLMELVGSNPYQVTGSIHWEEAGNQEGTLNNSYILPSGADYSQKFHVFSLVWTPTQISMYVDDMPYMTESSTSISSGTWPFNQPQFLIMNVAVGGDWPGPPTTATVFPESMYVDYVRVFQ
jgi:beta-glucanase (GH16 family)